METNGVETPTLTDAQILELLRSGDTKDRARGLDALFPAKSDIVLLLKVSPISTEVATTSRVNPSALFGALLWVCQGLGRSLGLDLQWTPRRDAEGKKILVARPGS
jgi:hypothetical protein